MDDLSKIIIGTGNYENVKSGNTLSVTGDGGNAWGYYGPAYKKLAPRLVTYTPYATKLEYLYELKKDVSNIKKYLKYKKQIEDEYIRSYYETRLKDLDVIELLNSLYLKYGNNIILLCHESPNEFCHRRLIADYIRIKTDIYIPEIVVDKNGNIKECSSINYEGKLLQLIDSEFKTI